MARALLVTGAGLHAAGCSLPEEKSYLPTTPRCVGRGGRFCRCRIPSRGMWRLHGLLQSIHKCGCESPCCLFPQWRHLSRAWSPDACAHLQVHSLSLKEDVLLEEDEGLVCPPSKSNSPSSSLRSSRSLGERRFDSLASESRRVLNRSIDERMSLSGSVLSYAGDGCEKIWGDPIEVGERSLSAITQSKDRQHDELQAIITVLDAVRILLSLKYRLLAHHQPRAPSRPRPQHSLAHRVGGE